MSFGKRMQEARDTPRVERDESRCFADGCSCRASISVEGGRWFCRFHAYKDNKQWPGITSRLAEFSWMVDLIGDIVKLDRAGDFSTARKLGADFFAESYTELIPAKAEPISAYIGRLNAALAHMVGSSAKPPPAWVPQCQWPDFMTPRRQSAQEKEAA